ncbi:hypothetical protein [Streptomyces zaomyceticus]|uniref:hypothetical protein n=1 Tax=Streptomyces zaomyceticus TaxID=68286 RepID=UPI00341D176C
MLSDAVVAEWWEQRGWPGSRFALVQQLDQEGVERITAPTYTCRFVGLSLTGGEFIREETVTGFQLRDIAAYATKSLSSSIHLELPSGIVTLHSDMAGDVFFLPAAMGSPRHPASPAVAGRTMSAAGQPAAEQPMSWFDAEPRWVVAASSGAVEHSPDVKMLLTPLILPRRAVAGRMP